MVHHSRMTTASFAAAMLDGKDITEELTAFVHFVGPERLVPGRWSLLPAFQLFEGHKGGTLNPSNVTREID